jgi:FMN phosphatase YigB (HAD superfamily)
MTAVLEDVGVSARDEVVFLVDVDNTLLDNDAVRDDVRAAFVTAYGKERAGRYWTIQERRFVELEYRDYLGAVQEWWEGEGCDARLVDAARIFSTIRSRSVSTPVHSTHSRTCERSVRRPW